MLARALQRWALGRGSQLAARSSQTMTAISVWAYLGRPTIKANSSRGA